MLPLSRTPMLRLSPAPIYMMVTLENFLTFTITVDRPFALLNFVGMDDFRTVSGGDTSNKGGSILVVSKTTN